MAQHSTALKISVSVLTGFFLITLVILGAIWVSHIDNRKAASAYPKCTGTHEAHKVVIKDDKVFPEHTDAKRCDTLTITNVDEKARIVAFGVKDKHVAYDGVSERYLSQNSKLSVTLVQSGTFKFHDHVEEDVGGTFTVN